MRGCPQQKQLPYGEYPQIPAHLQFPLHHATVGQAAIEIPVWHPVILVNHADVLLNEPGRHCAAPLTFNITRLKLMAEPSSQLIV